MRALDVMNSDRRGANRAQFLALVQFELMAWGLALVLGVGIAEAVGIVVAALYLVPTLILASAVPLLRRS